MTKNAKEKRIAREYQANHPGMPYTRALAKVRELFRAGTPYEGERK